MTEETWEIRIEEGKDTILSEENPIIEEEIAEINREELEERDILEEEGEIEEIDNPIMINRLYKKYLREPKDPEVGEDMINVEILLINSLKISIGKLQEITDGFLVDKEYISIFCLTETKENCANYQELGLTIYDKQRAGRQNQDNRAPYR